MRISKVLRNAEAAIFFTFTAGHSASTPLAVSLEALKATWTAAFSTGSWYSDFERKNFITGYVRSLEVTFAEHGSSHPHFHVAFTLDRTPTPEGLQRLADALLDRWERKAASRGLLAAPHAQEYRKVPQAERNTYAGYLTEQHALRPSKPDKQRTPGDLLLAAQRGDTEAWSRLREFHNATKGQRKIATSRGFYDATTTRQPAFPAASAITAS